MAFLLELLQLQLSGDLKKEAKILEERLNLFKRLEEMEDKVLV